MYDQLDFNKIIKDYGRIISSICSRMIMKSEIAEEAAQEAWMEIYQSLKNFKGESKISTYIYTIAYRVISNYSKKEKTYTLNYIRDIFNQDDLVYPENLEETYTHKEWTKSLCSKCFTGILHCLNSDSRLMYLFRETSNLSYYEISKIFNKPETSIRQIISRARRKIKNFMHNECILFNSEGSCRCRIKKDIEKIDLKSEFEKVRELMSEISIINQFDSIMSLKNFWDKYLG